MKKIGIYVHIPFCKSKCKYCNFTSFCNKEHLMQDYLKSLVKEIKNFHTTFFIDEKCVIDTIYIGGGTPSTLFLGGIATILETIKNTFIVEDDAEITIEANPNSVEYTKAQEWKSAGINRVSVGLQTIKLPLLKLMGRTHTKDDFVNAINIINSVGIKNINADLMIGLPSQRLRDVRKTLNVLQKLPLKHVSCYSLILEKDTPLYQEVKMGRLKEPNEEKTIAMYDFVVQYLKKLEFERYEVSNFAIPNYECRHNVNCWNLREYAGFGVSAHGFINDVRYSNENTIEKYIDLMAKNCNAIMNKEKIEIQEQLEEYIMLGLRLSKGIDLFEIKKKYNIDLIKDKKDILDKLLKLNLITIQDNFLSATYEGFHVLNSIIIELIS